MCSDNVENCALAGFSNEACYLMKFVKMAGVPERKTYAIEDIIADIIAQYEHAESPKRTDAKN
jgi:hypothetical protein